MEKYAVIGTGSVGRVIATGLANEGYELVIGSRNPEGQESSDGFTYMNQKDAMAWGDTIVLAVPGSAAEEVIAGADIEGKTVIDTCNPISGGPSANGLLPFFTERGDSLIQRLQKNSLMQILLRHSILLGQI